MAYGLFVRMAVYVAVALILMVFGYVALFSIGLPFTVTGMLMLALIGERRRADVLASALASPSVFTTRVPARRTDGVHTVGDAATRGRRWHS